jgi:hypothetical protein
MVGAPQPDDLLWQKPGSRMTCFTSLRAVGSSEHMNVTDFKFLGGVTRGVNLASAYNWKGKLFLFAGEKHFTKYPSEYILENHVFSLTVQIHRHTRESQ